MRHRHRGRGLAALKGALERPLLYIVVVAGYLAAFVLLTLVLRAGVPVGVACGIWGALGVVLTAVLSAVIFGEPLTPLMILGMVLVIAECCASRSGHRGHRDPRAAGCRQRQPLVVPARGAGYVVAFTVLSFSLGKDLRAAVHLGDGARGRSDRRRCAVDRPPRALTHCGTLPQ